MRNARKSAREAKPRPEGQKQPKAKPSLTAGKSGPASGAAGPHTAQHILTHNGAVIHNASRTQSGFNGNALAGLGNAGLL
jgi:hypothetical protein